MVSNMGFNLLAIPFSYVGLAIASAMSATLNAYLLYRGLAKADVYHFHVKCGLFCQSFIGGNRNGCGSLVLRA